MTPLPACFLTGFMGCGKTTVGRALATLTQGQFLELDERIAAAAGMTIREIFARSGEEGFRRREQEQLASLPVQPNTVVALGGGALTDSNLAWIREHGVICWLHVPFPILRQRIGPHDEGRPLWKDPAAAEALYESRRPGYERADFRVDGTGEPMVVARSVLEKLRAHGLC